MSSIQTRKNMSAPIRLGNFICVAAGVIAALVCGMQTVEEGLELLFLLPVAFTICSLLFLRAFSYWRDNVAFIIIFATIVVRYLVTPVLITFSENALTTVSPSPDNYRLAIFIQILELVAILTVIDCVWTRHKQKRNDLNGSVFSPNMDFKLSWTGILFLALLVFMLISRGRFTQLIDRYSTWWFVSEDTSPVYYYDYIAFEIIKSVVGVLLITLFAKYYHKSRSIVTKQFCFLMATAVALGMTCFYLYEQRATLAQLIISSIVVLFAFFPHKKKLMVLFSIIGCGAVLIVFMTSTMHYEFGGTNHNLLANMSKMAELYVPGTSMVAVTQQRDAWVRENMQPMTYLSDIISSTHIFGMFPFLRGINDITANIPSTNELFKTSLGELPYVLPNYSLWTYWVTDILGFVFEVLSMYIVVRVICYADEKKKRSANACYYYAFAYVETMLGQTIFMTNNYLLWHTFTNLPLWLFVFLFVNNLGNRFKLK